jgi:dual specificity MAP kinase phosphatase
MRASSAAQPCACQAPCRAQLTCAAYRAVPPPSPRCAGVLVHCGAGVSRSATLVMAWLMRDRRITATAARELVASRRSAVCINDGFWAVLCALERQLGVAGRWA